jgi:hypothetical protein
MAKLPIYRRSPCPACGAPADYSIDESGEIIPLLCDECVRAIDFTDPRVIAVAKEAGHQAARETTSEGPEPRARLK